MRRAVIGIVASVALAVGMPAAAGAMPGVAAASPNQQTPAVCSDVDHVALTDGQHTPNSQVWRSPTDQGALPPARAVTAPAVQNPTSVRSPSGALLATFRGTDAIVVTRIDAGASPVLIPTNRTTGPPVWSPDSTRLAYTATFTPESTSNALWVARADGSAAPTRVSPNGFTGVPVWSPNGTKIAIAGVESASFVVPADGSGAPVDISYGTRQLTGTQPVWSPDSSMLAWDGRVGASADVHTFTGAADGSGTRHQLSTDPRSTARTPVWFPDGSKVIFNPLSSAPADGSQAPTPLAPGLAGAEHAGLSPNGDRVAFLAAPPTPVGSLHLYVAQRDGSGRVDLTGTDLPDRRVRDARWSPDGAHLAFTWFVTPGGNRRLSIVPAAGGAVTGLSGDEQLIGSYAVNGSGTTVVYERRVTSPFLQVAMRPADGSGAVMPVSPPILDVTLLGRTPFAANGDVLYAGPPRNPLQAAWLAHAPFEPPPTMLAAGATQVQRSPDRTQVAWVAANALHVADADGTGGHTIPSGPGTNVVHHVWSPDSTKLAWAADVPGGRQIFTAPADGSAAPKAMLAAPFSQPSLPFEHYSDPEITWSPAGDRLAFEVRDFGPSSQIHVADPNVAGSAFSTGNEGIRVAWSPTGDRLAYIENDDGLEVLVLSAPFTGAATPIGLVPSGRGESISWAPGGSVLAVGSVAATRDDSTLPPTVTTTSQLALFKADGSLRTVLGGGLYASWTPDGQHLAWEEYSSVENVVHNEELPDFDLYSLVRADSIMRIADGDGSNPHVFARGPGRAAQDVPPVPYYPLPSPLLFSPNGDEVSAFDVVVSTDGTPTARAATARDVWRFPNWLRSPCGADTPGYHTLSAPVRLLDTRLPGGPGAAGRPAARVGPGETLDLQVAGIGAVPATNVTAVVVNLTVVGASRATHVTVGPFGSPLPPTSNVNVPAGDTRPNLVLAKVGAGGKISFTNNAGDIDLVVDLAGWLDDGTIQTGEANHPLSPFRALDTRDGTGAPAGRVPAGGHVDVSVTTGSGVPASAKSVVVNLTEVAPSSATHITAGPTGSPMPATSNVNGPAGETRPNLAVVPLGTDGHITLWNNAGTVDLVLDVVGWFGETSGSGVVSLPPVRIVDTRDGTGVPAGAIGPAQTVALPVGGRGGVPANASAVVVNLTGVAPSAFTHLTVWPSLEPLPAASNLNLPRGATAANLAIIKLGPDGNINLYNNSGSTNVVIDVMGYVT